MCRQYSLVHGEGPDVKVVDRPHTLHLHQTIPHLTVFYSCWSAWGADEEVSVKNIKTQVCQHAAETLQSPTFHQDKKNVPHDGEGGAQDK